MQRLIQIGNYIVRVLAADAQANQIAGNMCELSALLALLLVSGDRRDCRDTFDATQVSCSPDSLQLIEHGARVLVPTRYMETHEVTIAIDRLAVLRVMLGVDKPHITRCEFVQRMIGKTEILD